MRHTPGPWTASKLPRSLTWRLDAETWRDFAEVFGNRDVNLNAEGEMNARLIAAAPDLLEALKRAREMLGPHSLHADALGFAMIEAAIAKAEGR